MFEADALQAFRDDIRARILLEDRMLAASVPAAYRPMDDLLARQVDQQVATYVALTAATGLPPTPDMLRQLGRPGQLVHAVCCKAAGTWAAFRRVVAQRHPEIPYPTPLVSQDVAFASIQEVFVYHALRVLPGVTCVEAHPPLPGKSLHRADFLLHAASRRSVYVEVTMVPSVAAAETVVLSAYRERLVRKMEIYESLGLEPIVIWADEVVVPRVLADRLNGALVRLGLPSRPLPSAAWFEEAV